MAIRRTSPHLITYASLDVWATYQILNHLNNHPKPGLVNQSAPEGTPVAIWTADLAHIAAYGALGSHQSTSCGEIMINKQSQALVTVTSLLIPAALSPCHSQKPLSEFGKAPFELVCLWSHLWACQVPPYAGPAISSTRTTPLEIVSPSILEGLSAMDGSLSAMDLGISSLEHEPVPDSIETDLDQAEADSKSQAVASTLMTGSDTLPPGHIYSHVLKDPWHLMDMIKPPLNHSLQHAYFIALQDALFQFDKEDWN
jgi:hypothetical protein